MCSVSRGYLTHLDADEKDTRCKLYVGAFRALVHVQDLLNGGVVLVERKIVFHLLARHALLGEELVVRGQGDEGVPDAGLGVCDFQDVRGPKVVGEECAQLLERLFVKVLKGAPFRSRVLDLGEGDWRGRRGDDNGAVAIACAASGCTWVGLDTGRCLWYEFPDVHLWQAGRPSSHLTRRTKAMSAAGHDSLMSDWAAQFRCEESDNSYF